MHQLSFHGIFVQSLIQLLTFLHLQSNKFEFVSSRKKKKKNKKNKKQKKLTKSLALSRIATLACSTFFFNP